MSYFFSGFPSTRNNSALTGTNLAPEGKQVGMVQNTGTLRQGMSLTAGSYYLKMQGAQATGNATAQQMQATLQNTAQVVTSTKRFVWNGNTLAEERDAINNVTRRFYAQGEQIGGVSYFYTRDHLGSVREMVDTTGAIRARYNYDPFGTRTKVGGDLEASFGFTGHYYHQPSGLHLALYRAYDASTGRWISRDPIGEAGGLNLYGYVGNNPANLTDPLGLWYLTNPATWGVGDYEGVNGGWDNYRAADFEQGAYAGLDGLIPFADPFSDRYDPCAKDTAISKYLGTVSQEALLTAAGLKLARFRGLEYGRWKNAGQWEEGTHFHLDWGRGLGQHHLPQQSGNFLGNFRAVIGRWWGGGG